MGASGPVATRWRCVATMGGSQSALRRKSVKVPCRAQVVFGVAPAVTVWCAGAPGPYTAWGRIAGGPRSKTRV
jgi:hypothetical protein